MKTIQSSTDVKEALNEIALHIANNRAVAAGKRQAELLLIISREVYEIRSTGLNYNDKIEFAMQCDSQLLTQLFQVQ